MDRELRGGAVARLQHPNVVTLYRAGEDRGQPYLVSEFVRGESLDHRKKPIPWRQALSIGLHYPDRFGWVD